MCILIFLIFYVKYFQGGEESLIQRFLRLRCEVSELTQDLDSMTESARAGDNTEGLSIQVKTLEKQLEACNLDNEPALKTGAMSLDMLTKQVEGFKSNKSAARSGHVDGVYQVFVNQDNHSSVDVSSLDARLAKLEKLVGSNQSRNKSILSSSTDNKDLISIIKVLDERKQFLQQSHVDHVEGRLSALNFKINSISEQKTSLSDINQEDKINKLSSLMSSQSSLALGLLPEILERMETVAMLQEASKTWADIVSSVEQLQGETRETMSDTKNHVSSTKDFVDLNIKEILSKYSQLQKNLETIK